MKLTIKTLSQNTFKVDIEADKTVKELKDTIEKDHGKDYPSGAQKLIYSGKILADDRELSEYEIDEKKFVVLMITRPPAVPKPPVAEKASASTTKKESGTDSKSSAATADDKPSSNPSTVNATSNSSSSSTTTTTATTTTPSENRAARSTESNVNRPSSDSLRAASGRTLLSSEPEAAARLANLMAQPQFRQIQDLIQQSPHLLSSTIDALASSDPEMHSFISENPDVFVSALSHPPLAGNRSQSGGQQQPPTRSSGAAGQQAASNPSGRQQPGVDQVVVDVNEHDKEAIERLKELGFSEYLAVQAYIACDKDELLAANLLFQMDQ